MKICETILRSLIGRIEREQNQELRPTNDTDKSIQTRKSQLRPKPKSPRKHYPVYLSADAFKLF